jgi:hypothetical protein
MNKRFYFENVVKVIMFIFYEYPMSKMRHDSSKFIWMSFRFLLTESREDLCEFSTGCNRILYRFMSSFGLYKLASSALLFLEVVPDKYFLIITTE